MYKLIDDVKIISSLEEELKGLLIKKEKTVNEEVLEEGIKFFKTSEKLEKVAKKLNHNSQIIKDEEQKKKIINAATQLQSLAIAFKKVEYEYQFGDKSKAKKEYNELLKKYKTVYTILQKEDIKKALQTANSLVVTIASMAVSYCIIANLGNIIGFFKEDNSAKGIAASVAKIGLGCISRLPIYAIGNSNSKKIDKINSDEEVIRYVQKTFPEEFK